MVLLHKMHKDWQEKYSLIALIFFVFSNRPLTCTPHAMPYSLNTFGLDQEKAEFHIYYRH